MGKRGSGSGGGGGGGAKLNTSELKGTPKQVAYATDILERHYQKFDIIESYADKMIKQGLDKKEYSEVKKVVKEMKSAEINSMNKAISSGMLDAGTIIDRHGRLPGISDIREEVRRRTGLSRSYAI